jgi:hypothetical protein
VSSEFNYTAFKARVSKKSCSNLLELKGGKDRLCLMMLFNSHPVSFK